MTTRSATLFVGIVSLPNNTPVSIYTVPAGRTTILRSVSIYQAQVATVTIEEGLRRAGATTQRRRILLPQIAGDLLEFWCVLEEGDIYRVNNFGAPAVNVHFWLSGAELVG